jgi:hypothetical protein
MANFFFLSFDNIISIDHAKISVKFDNFNKGKARISLRMISTLSKSSTCLELYFLIKNDENPVKFNDIRGSEYNKSLDVDEFRQVAGAYGFEQKEDYDHCTVFTIEEFKENPDLENRKAIHPKEIVCNRVNYGDIPKELKSKVKRKDILIKVEVGKMKKILKEASSALEEAPVWMFQFRIFLRGFLSEEALKCWQSSSKSWSVDFDVHKQRNHEDLLIKLKDMKVLRYPESLELWFTIPHSHQFVASSPVYEKAFRLKSEDLAYKTEKQQFGDFTTREGDYAVKIVNKDGDFIEFSIICISPFLPGEKPETLRKDIEEFWLITPKFVTWENIFTPITLLVTLLSLIFGSMVAFFTDIGNACEEISTPIGQLNLRLLILSSIFIGSAIWAISAALSLASQGISRKRDSRLMKKGVFIGIWALTIAIVIVISVLCAMIIILLYY